MTEEQIDEIRASVEEARYHLNSAIGDLMHTGLTAELDALHEVDDRLRALLYGETK